MEPAGICRNGHPLPLEAFYCPECGTAVVLRCQNHHVLPAGATFCPECGEDVTASVANDTRPGYVARLRPRRRSIIVGAATLGLVLAVVLPLTLLTGKSERSAAPPPPTTAALTRAQSCDALLEAWVSYVSERLASNDGDVALTVYTEFGERSGLSQWLVTTSASYFQASVQDGVTAAAKTTRGAIERKCAVLTSTGFRSVNYRSP
ncbi:MAG: zinc ribbon domain-containing protein [Acidimicrobiales bacterium]